MPDVGAVAGRDADVVLVHEVVHAVHLVVEGNCAQQRLLSSIRKKTKGVCCTYGERGG